MNWLRPLFASKKARAESAAAERLHADVRLAARTAALFGGDGLPDTLDGRADAIALFSGLVTSRLVAIGPEGRALSTRLTDLVFDAFDAGLRETGVGDASIARKVRAIGERFVGLGVAVKEALYSKDPQASLVTILERNSLATGDGAIMVASALMNAQRQLGAQSDEEILSGRTAWQL